MSQSQVDRNLLFGILALQMDFISRDALLRGINAWVQDKEKPLGQVLVELQALGEDEHALLDALVQKHLEEHGNDLQKSLAVLSSVASLREDLEQLTDPDVQARLAHLLANRAGQEASRATRVPSTGHIGNGQTYATRTCLGNSDRPHEERNSVLDSPLTAAGADVGVVSYRCPNCDQKLRAPGTAVGTQARCPACGQSAPVPAAAHKHTVLGGARVLRYSCSHCGKRLRALEAWAGKAARCPQCHRAALVPNLPPPPDLPPADEAEVDSILMPMSPGRPAMVTPSTCAPAPGALSDTPGLSPTAALGFRQRYRILKPHAKGGLGEVFVAEDEELHR